MTRHGHAMPSHCCARPSDPRLLVGHRGTLLLRPTRTSATCAIAKIGSTIEETRRAPATKLTPARASDAAYCVLLGVRHEKLPMAAFHTGANELGCPEGFTVE